MLLEYLRVFLGWPPIALAIAVVFIRTFRRPIDGVIGRVVEAQIFGQAFKAVPPSQKSEGATEDRLASAAEAAQLPPETALPLPPELAGDPTAAAAVAFARNNPAQVIIEYRRVLLAYNSERLFSHIFGTQVDLLEYLATRHGESVSLPALAKFHDDFQKKTQNSEYQLRDYINFLVNFGVIAVSGVENASEYRITQQGVEFLSYIKANYPTLWHSRQF
jgi:hypothetical protein